MKFWYKNIVWKKNKRFTADQLDQYDPNKKDAFQRDLEERMSDDLFLSDATDGLQTPGAKEAYQKFSKNFLMDARFRTKAKFPWAKLIISSVFLSLMFYFLHWIQEISHYPETHVTTWENESLEISENPNASNVTPVIEAYQKPLTSAAPKNNTSELVKSDHKVDLEVMMDSVKINYRPLNTTSPVSEQKLINIARNYWWLNHYKLKKYHYVLDSDQLNPVLGGTGADNRPLSTSAEKDRMKIWTYKAYWTRSFEAFSQEQYQNVVYYCDLLLNQYENDYNAIFYRALALYHLNKPLQASWDFEVLLEANEPVFYDETQYYLALCYLANDQKNEAKNLLNRIITQKGFYQQKAQEIIKQTF